MALLVKTIPIIVLQDSNSSEGGFTLSRAIGIVRVFSHVHEPIFVDSGCYRIKNERFMRDKLDGKSVDHFQGSQGFCRFFWRKGVEKIFRGAGFGTVVRGLFSNQKEDPV